MPSTLQCSTRAAPEWSGQGDCQQSVKAHYQVGNACCQSIKQMKEFGWLYRRYVSGQLFCGAQVARAIRDGVLPHPSRMPCADCTGASTEYDHRDYNRPLWVTAVCRRCNARRGRAVPRQWSAVEAFSYVRSLLTHSYDFRVACRAIELGTDLRFDQRATIQKVSHRATGLAAAFAPFGLTLDELRAALPILTDMEAVHV